MRKFLCAYCPGKATFRQSSSWGTSFPNRDRSDYNSPVLMPRFPRSVILHACEAHELLKNNVPTHQSFWRHVRKLSLRAARLEEALSMLLWGTQGRWENILSLGACTSIPKPEKAGSMSCARDQLEREERGLQEVFSWLKISGVRRLRSGALQVLSLLNALILVA